MKNNSYIYLDQNQSPLCKPQKGKSINFQTPTIRPVSNTPEVEDQESNSNSSITPKIKNHNNTKDIKHSVIDLYHVVNSKKTLGPKTTKNSTKKAVGISKQHS